MFRADTASPARGAPARRPFILYVEGPGDRAILRAWAYRLLPAMAGVLRRSVILGGRQPRRAVEHFVRAGGAEAGLRGLCVLDRDVGGPPLADAEPGLEFFTWSRRHIESYLLVPDAIRRAMRLGASDGRVLRTLVELLPSLEDEVACRTLDAKRLLGPGGALPRALGQSIPLAGVARATRREELHPDVHQLFERLRAQLGMAEHRPEAL